MRRSPSTAAPSLSTRAIATPPRAQHASAPDNSGSCSATQGADLLHHLERIPVLPCCDKLAILDAHNGDAGNLKLSSRGLDSHPRSCVPLRRRPARADRVALAHHAVHRNRDSREGRADLVEERFKTIDALDLTVTIAHHKPGTQHFRDGFPPPFVPDFVKPGHQKLLVRCPHRSPPRLVYWIWQAYTTTGDSLNSPGKTAVGVG